MSKGDMIKILVRVEVDGHEESMSVLIETSEQEWRLANEHERDKLIANIFNISYKQVREN